MKMDQVNVPAPAVIGDLEKIDHAEKSRFLREPRSDVGQPDWFDRIDFDLSLLHAVPAPDFDMRARPNADTACDLSPANAVPQPFREGHNESLPV